MLSLHNAGELDIHTAEGELLERVAPTLPTNLSPYQQKKVTLRLLLKQKKIYLPTSK